MTKRQKGPQYIENDGPQGRVRSALCVVEPSTKHEERDTERGVFALDYAWVRQLVKVFRRGRNSR